MSFLSAVVAHVGDAYILKAAGLARNPFQALPPPSFSSGSLPFAEHILCVFDPIFDWAADRQTGTYKPLDHGFTMSSVLAALKRIAGDPVSARQWVYTPVAPSAASALFLAQQAALLRGALEANRTEGSKSVSLVFHHYRAFKEHTSSPQALRVYGRLQSALVGAGERRASFLLEFITRGRGGDRFLNPSYTECAGLRAFADEVRRRARRAENAAASAIHAGEALTGGKDESGAMLDAKTPEKRAALFRELCYGRTGATDPRVQHGFEDATHNACCLLGPKTRKGADATGNPIGKLSADIDALDPDVVPSAMKPWTTCMGSAVCSEYGQKYGDAYLKFAVSPDKSQWYLPPHGTRLSPACEHFLQEEVFGGSRHSTPGIAPLAAGAKCSEEDRARIRANVSKVPWCEEAR